MVARLTDEDMLVEEAQTDGDVALAPNELRVRPGTARSALRSRDFRVLWVATFSSNVGTWMQNVALGAFAYQLSHSAGFVALTGFAQLGPLLLLATVGGMLADAVDRRRLLVVTNLVQLVFSVLLALVAAASQPSKTLLLLVVLAIGVANALTGPPLASLLPNLVPRADLSGAIALQSVQMNLSRVVGPAIGGVLLPSIHASGVFVINAATYLFAVAGVLAIRPVAQRGGGDEQGLRRLLGGFAVARRDPLVRSVLSTIAAISFFCLPFIGLMPVVAAENMGMKVTGSNTACSMPASVWVLRPARSPSAASSSVTAVTGDRRRPGAVRRDAARLRFVPFAGAGVPRRLHGRAVLLRDGDDVVDAAAGAPA